MENNKDSLKFIIQRYDSYISSSNTKGSFLLSLNALIITLCVGNLTRILGDNQSEILVPMILVSILLISGSIAVVFIILALYPFTSSGNSSVGKYHSKIFFGSVAEYRTPNEYWESIRLCNDAEFEEDMAYQAHILAVGLQRKFRFLKIASWFIYVDLLVVVGGFISKVL